VTGGHPDAGWLPEWEAFAKLEEPETVTPTVTLADVLSDVDSAPISIWGSTATCQVTDKVRRVGLEPTTYGLKARCSTS
jgi:hypothetical protein